MGLSDKWEAIAQEAIEEAELVKCPGEAFAAGLKEIEGLIRDRRIAAEEEFGIEDDDDSDLDDDDDDDDED